MGTVHKLISKEEFDQLLTPAEVAAAFKVDVKTVRKWADSGKLRYVKTIGGHRRFLEAEVRSYLEHRP